MGQVSQWLSRGHRVRLAVLSSADTAEAWRSALPDGLVDVEVYRNGMQRVSRLRSLIARVVDWQPDVTYLRTMPWIPAIDDLAEASPVIAEVNSNESSEAKLRGTARGNFVLRLRRRTLDRVHGIVAVSDGLVPADGSCPSIVIPNGIDIGSLPVLPPAPVGIRKALMLVGANQPWQGVDLLIPMVERDRQLAIEVIGPIGPTTGHPIHERIRYHGAMNREEWYPIAAEATIGIGTLGLFRKGMSSVAPLKHREYLALGLPVVLACHDPDIPGNAPWALHLENQEWGTTLGAPFVEAFIDRWTGRRVSRTEVLHIDTREKETLRLRFIEQVKAKAPIR